MSKKSPPNEVHPKLPQSGTELAARLLGFHRFCADMNCRRSRQCQGGAKNPCFDQFWPQVPESEKVWVRGLYTALGKRQPVREALIVAEEAVQQFEALEKSWPQRIAAAEARRAPPRREPPTPRIRTL